MKQSFSTVFFQNCPGILAPKLHSALNDKEPTTGLRLKGLSEYLSSYTVVLCSCTHKCVICTALLHRLGGSKAQILHIFW